MLKTLRSSPEKSPEQSERVGWTESLKSVLLWALSCGLVSGIAGCASTGSSPDSAAKEGSAVSSIERSSEDIASEKSVSASDMDVGVEELNPLLQYQALYLESEIVNEEALFHDLISPKNYSKARRSLDRAFDLIAEGRSGEALEAELHKTEEALVEMTVPIILSEIFLFDVFDARQEAMNAGAQKRPEFKRADQMLRSMGHSLEEGIVKNILEEKMPILSQYERAHTTEIQERELTETLKTLQRAEKLGAARYFPEIHEQAQMKLDEARSFIAKYRGYPEGYREWVQEADFFADRLLSLTQSAVWISKANPAEIASAWEAFMQSLATQMNLQDIRGLPPEQQMSALLGEMESVSRDAASVPSEEGQRERPSGDPLDPPGEGLEDLLPEEDERPRGYPRIEKPIGPMEEKPTDMARARRSVAPTGLYERR